MKLHIAKIILLISIISVQAAWAGVTKNTIQLGTSDVVAHVPEDTTEGTYYVLQLDIPQGLTSAGVMDAVMEFYADISAATLDGWQNETPVVEVYILNSAVSGEVTPSQFRKPSAMVRNVRLGDNRRIRLNATEAVKYFLENPTKNYGLVLGSFRGEAEGRFTLKTGSLGTGLVARVTVFQREWGSTSQEGLRRAAIRR